MDKKGALELSVNAIVILIIAITMLGLGIGFVKGMFGKISTQVEEKISEEPEPPVPTGTDPITISRENIITQAKANEVIKIGIYNTGGAPLTIEAYPLGGSWLTCTGLVAASLKSNVQTIPSQEYKVFTLLADAGAVGTYLCSIKDGNAGTNSKDFTVKVTQ